jgi:hypothetical protein
MMVRGDNSTTKVENKSRKKKHISPERCRRSAETEILKGVATMTTQVQHEWRSMPDMLQGGDPDIVHRNM